MLPLIALFIAAFAFGTTEFVIAGVLPQVADGLGVSIPTSGFSSQAMPAASRLAGHCWRSPPRAFPARRCCFA